VLDRLLITTKTHELGALAGVLSSLAGALDATGAPLADEGARLVLGRLLRTTDINELDVLAQAMLSLAGTLAAADAPLTAVGAHRLLDRLRREIEPSRARFLAEVGSALAGRSIRLGSALNPGLLDLAQSGLAWSQRTEEAVFWAEALAGSVAAGSDAAALRPLADALRYPMAGGAPTDVLLAALKARDPRAPGAEAGLRANLDWLQRDHPDAQPFAPVTCPPPPPWAPGAHGVDRLAPLTESTQSFWAWFADKAKALLLR
jgi:hypothetical protein